MEHLRPNPAIYWGLRFHILTLILSLISLALPVTAHQLKVTDSVGGILHLEPNDTPKAQVPTLIWIALTHPGGALIALEDCNCSLAIYPSTAPDPIARPPLRSIATPKYQGVPGTEFTFPAVGTYTLIFQGSPRHHGSFKTFQLSYPVTVAAGASAQSLSQPQIQRSDQSTPAAGVGRVGKIWWVVTALVLVALGIGWRRYLRR
ncbi:MAG: hypothetical protein LVS60_01215 [Nodosilinea sp. LVE1205-7]|jgi:hypothetical protein